MNGEDGTIAEGFGGGSCGIVREGPKGGRRSTRAMGKSRGNAQGRRRELALRKELRP